MPVPESLTSAPAVIRLRGTNCLALFRTTRDLMHLLSTNAFSPSPDGYYYHYDLFGRGRGREPGLGAGRGRGHRVEELLA